MEILGYISACAIGFSLGLLGGGGSILTVPVLVYLIGIDPVMATAYSLFVVGAAASVGAFRNMLQNNISWRTAFFFAIPSFISVYLTRAYLIPAIPEQLFTIGGWTLTKGVAIMMFFALMMILAAVSMIRSGSRNLKANKTQESGSKAFVIILDGLVVGILTGLVGAGGGFLIIPALVLLAGLSMKKAIGTSLFIIAVKSLFGFVGDLQNGYPIDWQFLLTFTAIAVAGIFLGNYLSGKFTDKKLKIIFGWFVLLMAIAIQIKELFF